MLLVVEKYLKEHVNDIVNFAVSKYDGERNFSGETFLLWTRVYQIKMNRGTSHIAVG